MTRISFGLLAAAAAIAFAPAAMAASDYFLKIDDIKGEAATEIEVLSWSWGASNSSSMPSSAGSGRVVSPRDAASGQATGRRQHHPPVTASQNTQSLRESPTRASTGQTTAKASFSDLSIMRRPDPSSLSSLSEVHGFSLTLDKASPQLAKLCAQGQHFPKATLVMRTVQVQLEEVLVSSCAPAPPPAPGPGGSGARCVSGQCPAEMVSVTLTGRMKHELTGHVTLIK